MNSIFHHQNVLVVKKKLIHGIIMNAEHHNKPKPKPHKDKKSKPSTNTNTRRRAAHVKWAGTTIALGTFPIEVAESNCNRAKKLTEAWRSKRPKPSLEWVKRELELAGLRIVNDRPGRRRKFESDVLVRQQERLLSTSSVQPSSQPIGQDSSSTTRTISDEIDTASSFVSSSRPLTTRTSRDNDQPQLVSNILIRAVDGSEEKRTTTNNEGTAVGYHHSSLPVLTNHEQPTHSGEPIQQLDPLVLSSTSSLSSFTPHVGLDLRQLQHLHNNTSSSRALVSYQQMLSSFHPHHMSSNEASLSGITRMDINLPYSSSRAIIPNQQATTTTIPFQTARVHTAAIGFPFSSFTMMTQYQESLLNRYQQNARTNMSLNDHHTIQNLNSSSSTCPSRTFSVDQHCYSSPARALADTQPQYEVDSLNPPHTSTIRRGSNLSQYHDNLLIGRYRTPPGTERHDNRRTSNTLTTTINSEAVQVSSRDIIEEQTRHTNITSISNPRESNYRNHNYTSIFPSRTSCQVPVDQNGHSSPERAVVDSHSQYIVGGLNPPHASSSIIRRRSNLSHYDNLLFGRYRTQPTTESYCSTNRNSSTTLTTTSISSEPVQVSSSDIIVEQTGHSNITSTSSNPSDSNYSRNHNHTRQNFVNSSSIFPSRTFSVDQHRHSSPAQAVVDSQSQEVLSDGLNPAHTSSIKRRGHDLPDNKDCLLQGNYRTPRIENYDESTITTNNLPTTSICSEPVQETTRHNDITTTINPSDSDNQNDILVAESLLDLNMGLNST